MAHTLLQNIGVDVNSIISQKVITMNQAKKESPKMCKPIIDSIIEDINVEKMKK